MDTESVSSPTSSVRWPVVERSDSQLIEDHLEFVERVVTQLIRTLGISTHWRDDLVAAGYLGLVQAAGRFDPAGGVEFRTFSYHRIRGAIIDALRELSDLSADAYRYARGLKAALAVRDAVFAGESPPTPEEGLAQVFEIASQGAIAFRMSMDDARDEVEQVADEANDTGSRVQARSDWCILRKLIPELPELERTVIEGYYIDGRSFVEIADESFNSSRSWVSRLHARGLKRLRALVAERYSIKEVL